MFSVRQKREIADAVQAILRATNHPELPAGEIQFVLRVFGEHVWSCAEIENNGAVTNPSVNPWNEAQDPCHEPQPSVVKEPLTTQPDPKPNGGKTGDEEICWHTPIRQNPFTGGLDMKSECGHTITADEEDKRFVPPTTCLRCGKPRRFKL